MLEGPRPLKPHLTILALARDCADSMPRFVALLETLSQGGIDVLAIVGENGSVDGTRALLELASEAGAPLRVVATDVIATIPARLTRMCAARAMLALEAAAHDVPSGFVAVLDLDDVLDHTPPASAFHEAFTTLADDPTIAAVAARSVPYYYDVLALRWTGHHQKNVQTDLDLTKRRPWGYYRTHREIYDIQRRMTAAIDPVCTSAFNGLCIYRAGDYFAQRYDALMQADVCEHVPFNEAICARGGRRIKIGVGLIVGMPHEHGPVGPFRFILDRIRKLPKLMGAQ